MWKWKQYSGRVYGLELKGDPTIPATTWWNMLILRWLFWSDVTVLEIPQDVTFYRVGYIAQDREPMYFTTLLAGERFAVRHGREDCRFFAVMEDGTELPLKIIQRLKKDELPPGFLLV